MPLLAIEGMNMDHVGNLVERPRLYYNIDGVGELGCGFMYLCVALLMWLQTHSSATAIWNRTYLFVAYWSAMCLAIHYGSKAIKSRITYPRTGFVEYRTNDRWRPAIVAGAIAAILPLAGFLAVRRHWDIATPGSLIGLGLAASYAYGFARAVRWKLVVAGAMAAGSLVIAVLPADFLGAVVNDSSITHPLRTRLTGAFLVSFMLFGALLLMSGGISFYLYLRRTGAPAQEGQ
jgi:hypothetical protein